MATASAPIAARRARGAADLVFPPPARRVFEGLLIAYRRTWMGTIVSSFLTPVLFLLAMGVGLGRLVDRGQAAQRLGDVSYLGFIAPGLLAATVMQVAAQESMWPIMAGIKWLKTFHAMIATPVSPFDVVMAHVWFLAVRAASVATVFLAIITVFGAVVSPWAVVAVPVAVLTALAFACPIMAFAATRESDQGFAALSRFVIQPLFLFSGSFFPISQLPAWLRPVAWVTPLWHGVEVARGATLGHPRPLAWALHVAVLLAYAGVGLFVARLTFERRLIT
ncbi:MAG: ABC transporter permease [Actinobacteria bacterium]|nr:ABC transporter permease [Actinomycetota bacterium]